MARPGVQRGPRKKRTQYCTFLIADRLYGVDILDVKEVNPDIGFTTVFHASERIKGLVNIRGRIHLVLDLRRVLGLPSRNVDEKSRLVLFKPHVGEDFGILVDAIGDVKDVDADAMESAGLASRNGESETPDVEALLAGVYKLDSELMLVLKSNKLAQIVEKQAISEAAPLK